MDQGREESQAEDRFDNYATLSRLYRLEVDSSLLDDLIESSSVDLTGNELFDSGCASIRSFVDSVEDRDKALSDLAIDYCLVFLGYGVAPERADETKPNAAYPYESFYRTGSKTLGGDSCIDVSKTYRESMFMPQRDRIIAEDHIACELEFLQFLARMELEALREGDEKAVREAREKSLAFLKDHLLVWIGPFREAVEGFAETDFYRGLPEMTQGWIEMDAALLEESLAYEEDACNG